MSGDFTPPSGEWWFVVADVLFVQPSGSEVRTFSAPIGLCLKARRAEVVSPYETGDVAAVYGVGEPEWVRAEEIAEVFRTEVELYRHLWPELYPATRGETP